jgi:hypothetical protein
MKIIALAAVLALAGCSAEVPPEKKPDAAPPAAPAGAPAKAPAAAASAYPLTTCVISGDNLGEMGEPVVYMHEGTEVRFCCGKCIAEFKKDPKKYIAMIEAARKK